MPTIRKLIARNSAINNGVGSFVELTNIPQEYSDLEIYIQGRARTAAINSWPLTLRFNNDRGSNYASTYFELGNGVFSVGTQSYSDGVIIGTFEGSGSGYSGAGITKINIPNYSRTDRYKTYVSSGYASGLAGNNETDQARILKCSGKWNSTAGINRISIFQGSPNAPSVPNDNDLIALIYGIVHVPNLSGGNVSIDNGMVTHVFTATSSINVIEPGDAEILVVAGGGGGGFASGGGGGAGGIISGKVRLPAGVHTVTVGAGGAGATLNPPGSQGSNSSIGSSIVAIGGGGGGSNSTTAGTSGGSGGAGANNQIGGTGTSGQGFAGGSGVGSTHAAGGGGYTAVGGSSSGTNPGTAGSGGAGQVFNLLGFAAGGGGGGGAWIGGTPGTGGLGGGGAGKPYASGPRQNGDDGAIHTGGGGGGGGYSSDTAPNGGLGGVGGSGIVIIRYPYIEN